MMNVVRYFVIALAITIGGDSFAQLIELRQRCEEDNLFPNQALERFKWLESCHPDVLVNFHDSMFPEFRSDPDSLKIEILADEWLYTRGRLRERPRYLTFGLSDHSNPHGWQAPIQRNAPCGMPRG